jgi:hypothetical protein
MPVPCSQPQAIPSMYMFSLLFVERNVNMFFFSLLLTVTVLFKRIFGALLTGSKRDLEMFFFFRTGNEKLPYPYYVLYLILHSLAAFPF